MKKVQLVSIISAISFLSQLYGETGSFVLAYYSRPHSCATLSPMKNVLITVILDLKEVPKLLWKDSCIA